MFYSQMSNDTNRNFRIIALSPYEYLCGLWLAKGLKVWSILSEEIYIFSTIAHSVTKEASGYVW